ncbi:MAG: hypothetical protein K940chlam1_00843 [Candidatus Anoxychlamydiales bacterium]|nr:hypothetical protein [Candidatus Anoxychlamydiales bacterium]NGX35971.1 hypothetical protein [Candidatus Anoxychlamydiales bacterium]
MLKENELQILEENYEDAIRFFNNGLFLKASELLKDLAVQKPTTWQIWFSLAKALQKSKEYKKAITAYNIVLVLDSTNTKAYFYLAESYLSINKKEAAKEALEKATKICTNDLLKDQILILKNQNGL